ncbi:hypothetical protein [Glutamicibacter sp. NPDC087583]|uniref:hypothetical protein n=1 Tax=Glutamicibacter sp. NPDC087583 TaxID=3363995 RepID=UPI0038035ABA
MTLDQTETLASLFWDAACSLPPSAARTWVVKMPIYDEEGAALVQRAAARFSELSVENVRQQIELEADAWAEEQQG